MYRMTPNYYGPTDDISEHTEVVVKAVLILAAGVAIGALVLIAMADLHFAWLRLASGRVAALSTFASPIWPGVM